MANQPSKYSKFLVGAASAALVASAVAPVASAADFKDTKGNTHEEAINALSDAGVISGYPDGTFLPNKTLSRSDVVKLMGKWLVAEGSVVPTDYKTNPRFADLKSTSNDELLKFAAVVKDNGVFVGTPDGKLDPTGNITRENMAVVLVRAFDRVHDIDLTTYVAGQDFKKDVTDLGKAKAEARPAIDVLDFFDITNPAAPAFSPKSTTTRGQFATFLYKTTKTDFSDVTTGVVGSAEIKAVNATTVEVTFKDTVENLNSLNFKIDGLTVSNAAVKQSNDKVVVLTTAVQKGGEKYTVTLNEKSIGTFNGVSDVVPTKIDITTQSVQGKVGAQAILSADVGVKQAGIPVTFNVKADTNTTLNKDQVFEAVTNADGIAQFSYTQYATGTDTVVAYPTGAPAVRSLAAVYWGVDSILTVTPQVDTEGNSVTNGANKVYKVTYKDPKTGTPVANQKLHVSFVENVGVTIDKTSKATVNGTNPMQLANGTAPITAEVITDSKGEATFTVSGHNTTVTPVVFLNQVVNNADVKTWDATKLQAQAEKLVFGATQAAYVIDVTREGGEEAARYETNGREYKVVLKTKDGKVAANEIVNVAFNEDLDRNINTNTKAYFTEDDKKVLENGKVASQTTVKTNAKGEATFVISSDELKDYATPIVWLDINTSNAKEGKLDDGEAFKIAPISYFADSKLTDGTVKSYLGSKATKEFKGTEVALFKFTAANQSGNAMSLPTGYDRIEATFTVLNTGANDITVEGNVVSPNRSYTTTKISAVVPEISVVSVGNKTTSVKVTANGTAIPNTNNNTDRPINLGNHTAEVTFTSTKDIPSIAVNQPVEWVNINTNKMKLSNFNDTIDYSKAEFLVSDRILATTPNSNAVVVPAQSNDTFTKTTRATFNDYIRSGSTVTFTKGVDGVHTVRLEAIAAGGTNQGPNTTATHTVSSASVTPGNATLKPAKAAEYTSSKVTDASVTNGTFVVTVNGTTPSSATITIEGNDTVDSIKTKINGSGLVGATAAVSGDYVVITVGNTTDSLVISTTTIPGLFGNATKAPTAIQPVSRGTASYNFTSSTVTNILPAEKVTVNGTTYTAGTINSGITFDASGSLAQDLVNLAAAISFTDNSLSAVSSSASSVDVLTLTEDSGKEGTVTFGPITVK